MSAPAKAPPRKLWRAGPIQSGKGKEKKEGFPRTGSYQQKFTGSAELPRRTVLQPRNRPLRKVRPRGEGPLRRRKFSLTLEEVVVLVVLAPHRARTSALPPDGAGQPHLRVSPRPEELAVISRPGDFLRLAGFR